MDRTLKCEHSFESYYFTIVLFFNFPQLVILENLLVLDLALSGVEGLIRLNKRFLFDGLCSWVQ